MSKIKFIELPTKHSTLYVNIYSVVMVCANSRGGSYVLIGSSPDDNIPIELTPQEVVARLEAAKETP